MIAIDTNLLVYAYRSGCPEHKQAKLAIERVAFDIGVAGIRIFDLQIGLLAVENGATELWTHDAGFLHIPELTVKDPLS